MFLILHRLYVMGWMVLIVSGLAWAYPRTGVSEPLMDWFAVWQNKGDASAKPVGEISGTVIKVIDGSSMMVRAQDRQLYSIALLGIVPPAFKPNTTDGLLAQDSKARLSDWVLSNDVQITLTWIDPQRRGVGVARLGETNINAAMVESGLVQFKPKFIKGLPLRDQYALMRADRLAKERQP